MFRSTFLPRAIGVLLAIDGLAYLVYGFAIFWPAVAAIPESYRWHGSLAHGVMDVSRAKFRAAR